MYMYCNEMSDLEIDMHTQRDKMWEKGKESETQDRRSVPVAKNEQKNSVIASRFLSPPSSPRPLLYDYISSHKGKTRFASYTSRTRARAAQKEERRKKNRKKESRSEVVPQVWQRTWAEGQIQS